MRRAADDRLVRASMRSEMELANAAQRAALVQDWFFTPGGSEQVALELDRLLLEPDVYTSFADRETQSILGRRLHTWPLQRPFGPTRRYRSFLPLYAWWFGNLDLRRYDLVLSSSSAFAKAVRTGRNAQHISYIHTPMRYAWDLEGYLAGSSLAAGGRGAARILRPWLQRWDLATSRRPDVLVANSATVRERIRQLWNREAEVIHPPVALDDLHISHKNDGYLLVVARLLAYRRLDLVVKAATRMGRRLIVVGDGPEGPRLRAAAGPTVRFVGRLDRAAVVELYQRCHAYVVSGEEDFGIAPVEAMGAGKPVIAYRAGGALETVIEDQTGVFFDRPTSASLADAIERLDTLSLNPAVIRANATRFEASEFRAKWLALFTRLGIDPSLYHS